ncbi:choice-of-anchor C family protein [Duganella sp. P38]|uniref:choice-of-anchor C family protein n=1 Tax=Duganella sp. P38 TaxID=3423949 RepID=UPI003D79A55F
MCGLKAIASAAALLLAMPMAHANLIQNGGFETTSYSGSHFTDVNQGSTLIAPWNVSGSVDLIKSYWTAAEGQYSIDLNGNGEGRISQSFSTVAGQAYTVSFWLAGNPDIGGQTKWLEAGIVGDGSHAYEFSTVHRATYAMGWSEQRFSFVASGINSTLFFQGDARNGVGGAALDNIVVTTAVPEPSIYVMLLVGAGLMGLAARRGESQREAPFSAS